MWAFGYSVHSVHALLHTKSNNANSSFSVDHDMLMGSTKFKYLAVGIYGNMCVVIEYTT